MSDVPLTAEDLGRVFGRLAHESTRGNRSLTLYLALCSPGWDGPRRVEQERIPIERAATTVRSLAVVTT